MKCFDLAVVAFIASLLSFLSLINCGESGTDDIFSTPIEIGLDKFTQSGFVVDVDGNPVTDAQVWAVCRFSTPVLRRFTSTDENGRFALRLRALEPGPYRWELWANKGSSGGGTYRPILLNAEEMLCPALIVLQKHGHLTGTVTTEESSKPLENVKLFFDNGQIVVTNQLGQFSMGGLTPGNHRVVAVTRGRVRKRVVFDTTATSNAELDFSLAKGGRIRGLIRSGDGIAIHKATIQMLGSGNPLAMSGWETQSDTEGKFEWDGIPYDRERISFKVTTPGFQDAIIDNVVVQRDEFAPGHVVKMKSLPSKTTGNIEQVVFDMRSNTNLQGNVVDTSAVPIKHQIIYWVAADDHCLHRETMTDENGNFSLRRISGADGYLVVSSRHYAPFFASVDSESETCNVQLQLGKSLSGIVESNIGHPLAGVGIYPVINADIAKATYALWAKDRIGSTNVDGTFRIEDLPESGITFDFLNPNVAYKLGVELDMNTEQNRVAMQPSGAIRGRVFDDGGKPIRDFNVKLLPPIERRPTDVLKGFPAIYTNEIAFTRDDGQFAISDFAPSALYRIQVVANGYRGNEVDRIIAVNVDDLNESQELTVRLTKQR